MSTIDGTISTPAKVYRNRGYSGVRFTLTTDEGDQVAVDISEASNPELTAHLRTFAQGATCGSRLVVTGMLGNVTDMRTGCSEVRIVGKDLPTITTAFDLNAA